MNFDLQLDGQRALVTGGTRGTGAALVQRLAALGWGRWPPHVLRGLVVAGRWLRRAE
jgi:hypothetical protein